jgi:hypothetical protein
MSAERKTYINVCACSECGMRNPVSARYCCQCNHALARPVDRVTETYRCTRRRADRWLFVAVLFLAVLFAGGLIYIYSQDTAIPFWKQYQTPRRIFKDMLIE